MSSHGPKSAFRFPESGIRYHETMSQLSLRSKALFGNRHLLAMAAQIAVGDQEFVPRDLETGLGLPPSTVHRSLAALATAGLMIRLPRGRGEREQRYRRLEHSFWQAARELHDEARRTESATREGDAT
jgi:DNA-binding MarR family transcriptional regulator